MGRKERECNREAILYTNDNDLPRLKYRIWLHSDRKQNLEAVLGHKFRFYNLTISQD